MRLGAWRAWWETRRALPRGSATIVAALVFGRLFDVADAFLDLAGNLLTRGFHLFANVTRNFSNPAPDLAGNVLGSSLYLIVLSLLWWSGQGSGTFDDARLIHPTSALPQHHGRR